MAKKKKIQISLGGLLGSIGIDEWAALQICNDLLSGIAKSDILDECKSYPQSALRNERDRLRDSMIKILEEKFKYKYVDSNITAGFKDYMHRKNK